MFYRVGKLSLSFAFVLITLCNVSAQTNVKISQIAREYLEKALDIMQKNSLHKKEVDWAALRRKTFEKAAGSRETTDTWDAIRFALNEIDNHSFLQLSKDLREKEEQRREDKTQNSTAKEEKTPSPFASRRQPEGFLHKIGDCVVPRVVVPAYGSQKDMGFSATLHKFIAESDKQVPCGWIVDLRGNGGGNVFPMLAGIGVLLGEGDAVFAQDSDGGKTAFFYRKGQAGLTEPNGKGTVIAEVEGDPYQIKKQKPVAVLIDRGTGSSGEIIAIAFRGRENTRFFGEHTFGASTSTEGFKLSDGANMVLATGVDVDLKGNAYPSGLEPDVNVPFGDKVLPAEADPVIQSALDWLNQTSDENENYVREFIAAFNTRNLTKMLEMVSDEIQWININKTKLSIETEGREALKKNLEGYFKSCPSCKSDLKWVLGAGGRVTALERASWTQQGAVKSAESISVYELKDNKIHRVYYFPADPIK